jgi:hypothetical protein
MSSKEEAFRNQTWHALSQLTEAVAQIGQALSVHLPDADIDHTATMLTRVNNTLNVLERMIND